MRTVKIYLPPGKDPPVPAFFAALEPKLQQKLKFQLLRLAQLPLSELKEPHFKHFTLEKYQPFYEMRERNKVLVRVIFTISDDEVLLLVPFIKRQSRDSMRALDQAIGMLADLREHPERSVEYAFYKEDSS